MKFTAKHLFLLTFIFILGLPTLSSFGEEKTVRVFIFGGQSNMVGSDSKVKDIKNFPPYIGLEQSQPDVMFSYCLGRENKTKSDGWVELQPVNGIVGPELSFARKLSGSLNDPIAIIKCAAGGTHLGGDWNPDEPSGFKMYPLMMELIQTSLKKLKDKGLKYKVEAVMWHQGENDMFNKDYMKNYGTNLENFLKCWRRDLKSPKLNFFIGELCTKTIWGMDLRPRMYAISLGQKSVTEKDPNATYVPNNHIGVEIGGGVGLHYHYGTLGQLQHGENYADAYLKSVGKEISRKRVLEKWPYKKGQTVDLFVLAGHRNMEGERAFVQKLQKIEIGKRLSKDMPGIAFKYSLGGGVKTSNSWEPLGLTGYYDTFGPELSFAHRLLAVGKNDFALAKFTHSGSQIIDWTPEGSIAKDRMLYNTFISFVRESISEVEAKGNKVNLAGIMYHVGENDMSFFPYRKDAPQRIQTIILQSRKDLALPKLKWFVGQPKPTDHERVNKIDVVANLREVLDKDPLSTLIFFDQLPIQEKQLVIDTPGIVYLGEEFADVYLKERMKESHRD